MSVTLTDTEYRRLQTDVVSLKERLTNMEAEKKDGLAELQQLRTKTAHWRQLYQQTQQQYVTLHGHWTELKRHHDKKCNELPRTKMTTPPVSPGGQPKYLTITFERDTNQVFVATSETRPGAK